MDKRTILVTGGAGFIGSHIIDSLMLDEGWDRVICVDDLSLPTESGDKMENLEE